MAETMTLPELAKAMSDMDFAMLMTHTEGGLIAGRPMSNNGDVDYDGDSYYFTYDTTRMVADIGRDERVMLSFRGRSGLLGKPPMMVAVQGVATLVRDRQAFEAHWQDDLERWFEEGVDTPGLVMIRVSATRIHYWDGEDDGEVAL